MTRGGIINEDIAVLSTQDGEIIMVPVFRARTSEDCAMVALGPEGGAPPAITVGEVDGALKALYFETSPDDMLEVNAEWRRAGGDRYGWVETPIGNLNIPAALILFL